MGSTEYFKIGDKVIWRKAARWGGKDPVQATFLGYAGKKGLSAEIELECREETPHRARRFSGKD